MPRKVHPDDLGRAKRNELVQTLRKCIETGRRESEDRNWSIPNTRVEDAILPTYGFPANRPEMWFASTRFPKKNTTRNAFLIAVSTQEPVSIAFEFNVGLKPSNRMNFRFQQQGDDRAIVRCKGSFTFNDGRKPASEFFEYVRRHKLDLEIERVGRREFVRLFELSLNSIHTEWPRFYATLGRFAKIVDAYKHGRDPHRP
jgi:hypothetical protein